MIPYVTVAGSLHYDIMIGGAQLPRRGETAVGRSWMPKCGGKGRNQAVACANAGARTMMIGCVGADEFGHMLLGNLDRNGVERSRVGVSRSAATGMSVAISEPGGDYGAVIVSGANLDMTPHGVWEARDVLTGTAVLVLQNEVPDEANSAAAGIVRSAGGYVVLNAAPARAISPALATNVDLLVVNAVEAAEMASLPMGDGLDDCRTAASRLSQDWPGVVVTAGGNGLVFADQFATLTEIAAERVRIRSTHGAGDCFVGTLAAMLSKGVAMRAALQGASRAAAALVAGGGSHEQE